MTSGFELSGVILLSIGHVLLPSASCLHNTTLRSGAYHIIGRPMAHAIAGTPSASSRAANDAFLMLLLLCVVLWWVGVVYLRFGDLLVPSLQHLWQCALRFHYSVVSSLPGVCYPYLAGRSLEGREGRGGPGGGGGGVARRATFVLTTPTFTPDLPSPRRVPYIEQEWTANLSYKARCIS